MTPHNFPEHILLKRKKRILYQRLIKSMLFTTSFLALSLIFGMWGYHSFNHLSWIDSFVNASMILSGMGPVSPLESDEAKLFAGCYAIYSGGAFLIAMAVLLAPIIHHFFKSFEMELEKESNPKIENK